MAQSLAGAWNALFVACQGLYQTPDLAAAVVVGDPGDYQADLIVAFGDIRTPIDRPTMGSGRSREKDAEIDIVFSKFIAGGDDVTPQAIADVYTAEGLLEAYLRTSPNEKLGGACWDAYLSHSELHPYIVWADERLDDGSTTSVAVGRAADCTSTVTVRVRI